MGPIANFDCYEAGHPVPDENSFKGTQAALDLVANLTENDTVLFLLSGGGSALFEKPLVPGAVLQDVTSQLLGCGAVPFTKEFGVLLVSLPEKLPAFCANALKIR